MEKVSEQAASISSIDANNNKQVKLQSPPGCHRSAVWKHFGFKIITVNGKQVTECEKTVCRICYNDVSFKAGKTSNMAAHLKRKHAISRSDSSHNTVSSCKIPQHQSTSSASNSLVSNTSQLKLHEFSSAKSKFSSNSQNFFSNQIFKFQVTCIRLAFLFIKIISSLLI